MTRLACLNIVSIFISCKMRFCLTFLWPQVSFSWNQRLFLIKAELCFCATTWWVTVQTTDTDWWYMPIMMCATGISRACHLCAVFYMANFQKNECLGSEYIYIYVYTNLVKDEHYTIITSIIFCQQLFNESELSYRYKRPSQCFICICGMIYPIAVLSNVYPLNPL